MPLFCRAELDEREDGHGDNAGDRFCRRCVLSVGSTRELGMCTRSPICGGDNDALEHNPRPCSACQPATFRRTRIGRPSRSQWSPQHGRGDHGTYGSNAMYRGGQVIQDFGQGRDMSEDLSEMDNHLLWSSCRPHQVQTSVQTRVHMNLNLCLSRHLFGTSGGRKGCDWCADSDPPLSRMC